MTVSEAIKKLKTARFVFQPESETFASIDIAIRSLEAWEKVRTEIEKIGGSEEKSVYKCQQPSYVRGLEKSLEIISKHLAEVTENEENA